MIDQLKLAQLSGRSWWRRRRRRREKQRWWRPSEKAQKDAAEPFPWIEAESKKPNLFLKAEFLLLTEHLQRNPSNEKGKGRPLPAQGTPLAKLSKLRLSRKKSGNFRPKVCGKYALQGSSRALYTPLDPTHKESTWPVPFQGVGYAVLFGGWWSVVWWVDLFWWFGLAVVVCSDGLIWWSGLTMVCCGVRMQWPDLWSDCLYGCLMDWFRGLIWRCAWARWSGLTAENWKDNKLSLC